MSDDARDTRTRLVEATLELGREVGYAHLTTRAIARAAGVAEGTIYRHFPDKASLIHAGIVHRHRPLMEWMATLPERAGTGTVAGNLVECLRRLSELRETMLPLELAMLTDPELAKARRLPPPGEDVPPGPPEMLAAYLGREQDLGRVRGDVDPHAAAAVILATLFGLVAAPEPPPGGLRMPSIEDAVRVLLHGIAVGT